MKNKGIFWHVHHSELLEYCYDYKERADCIKTDKPANEIETRLRLFKPVRGKLPAAVIKACVAYDKACDARSKAYAACNEAWDAYGEACDARSKAYAACNEAWDAYGEACAARSKARDAYNKAYDAYDKACDTCNKALDDNMPAILTLHAKECPNCSWDGNEIIFPKV